MSLLIFASRWALTQQSNAQNVSPLAFWGEVVPTKPFTGTASCCKMLPKNEPTPLLPNALYGPHCLFFMPGQLLPRPEYSSRGNFSIAILEGFYPVTRSFSISPKIDIKKKKSQFLHVAKPYIFLPTICWNSGNKIETKLKNKYLYRMVNVLERWVLYKIAKQFFLVNG